LAIKVKEIYPAIIGEGRYSGYCGLLVRVAGCNLRCGYCDTRYAWRGGRNYQRKDLIERVKKSGYQRVLITGGEPLLQEEMIEFLKELVHAGKKVLLETNGSISIKKVPKKVHIIMDLKSPDSGEETANDYQNLKWLKSTDELKLVLVSHKDYQWAKRLLKQKRFSSRCHINFSSAFGFLKPAQLARWIIKDRLNVRLNLQWHRLIFPGKARGV